MFSLADINVFWYQIFETECYWRLIKRPQGNHGQGFPMELIFLKWNLFMSFTPYAIPSYLPYPVFRDREHNPAINVGAFIPLPEDADETHMSYGPGGTSIKPIQLNRVHKSLQNWSCNARIKGQHTPQSSRQPDGGQNSPLAFCSFARTPVTSPARQSYMKGTRNVS